MVERLLEQKHLAFGAFDSEYFWYFSEISLVFPTKKIVEQELVAAPGNIL